MTPRAVATLLAHAKREGCASVRVRIEPSGAIEVDAVFTETDAEGFDSSDPADLALRAWKDGALTRTPRRSRRKEAAG